MRIVSIALLASLAAACAGSNDKSSAVPASTATASASATPEAAPTASASAAPTASAAASAAPEAPKGPTPAVRFAEGFATPESVLYDAENDRYLVSNIQGKPLDADNNGFISALSPDGKVTNLKFIEGGKDKTKLDAPKGMAIHKGELFVADINVVRRFDLKTGAPKGEIKLDGATFANDVFAADGKVYVTDSGLKPDFSSNGSDAVFVIENGKAKPLAKSADLGGPNGVYVDGKNVWIATFGSGELYRLDEKGKKVDAAKIGKGGLDGLLKVGDAVYVSSWNESAVFKGKPGGAFEPVLSNLKAPADIGFDTKRSRVLVPRFMENAVEAYDVK